MHERCWRIGIVFVVSGFLNYFNYFMFYLIVYFFLILNYSGYFYFNKIIKERCGKFRKNIQQRQPTEFFSLETE